MDARRSAIIRPVIFSLGLFLTGCAGYVYPTNPGYGAAYYPSGPAYYPGYVAAPVVVPVVTRAPWYVPPPGYHHHRDRDRRFRHGERG